MRPIMAVRVTSIDDEGRERPTMTNAKGNRYGAGSIAHKGKRNGRDVWECRVSFGKNPISGRYESVSRTVVGSKAAAKKMCEQLKREHDSGVQADGLKTTFAAYAHSWMEERERRHEEYGEFARTTLDDNQTIVKSLSAHVGDLKVHDMTAKFCRELLAGINKDGSKSGSRMRKYHAVLNGILKQAVVDDLLLANPLDKVLPPKAQKGNREGLAQPDMVRLRKALDDAEERAYERLEKLEGQRWDDASERVSGIVELARIVGVKLTLMSGVRRGELLALVWGDIDLQGYSVRVERSLNVHGQLKPPKTAAGVRKIPLDSRICECLQTWKEKQSQLLASIGIDGSDDVPVVCSSIGGYTNTSNFSAWWAKYRESLGFPELLFHELRHSYASHLIANGLDYVSAAKVLGHDKPSTTMDIYSHAQPDTTAQAAAIMSRILNAPELTVIKRKTA